MRKYAFKMLLFLLFFGSALYLLGFSFSGANVYGIVDSLIPLERILCFIFSMCMFGLAANTFWNATHLIEWKSEGSQSQSDINRK